MLAASLSHKLFADSSGAICQISLTLMRTRNDISAKLVGAGIIAIIRAQKREQALPAAKALAAGGLNVIEITLTTPDAFRAIREVGRRWASELWSA